jgi:hypothetical protein
LREIEIPLCNYQNLNGGFYRPEIEEKTSLFRIKRKKIGLTEAIIHKDIEKRGLDPTTVIYEENFRTWWRGFFHSRPISGTT